MKNLLKLASIFLVFISVVSCSKDDDKLVEPSIVGKWYCAKLGRINANGQLEYNPYQGACSINVDFLLFNSNSFSETSYGGNCESYTGEFTYEKRNNNLIVYRDNIQVNYYYEILSITDNELSLKQVYTNFNNQVYLIYKKVN